jgi:MoxR-like ATPase
VAIEDVHKAAFPCLRHRILLNFDALADDATTDTLIRQTLMELDRKDDPSPSKAKKK